MGRDKIGKSFVNGNFYKVPIRFQHALPVSQKNG